MNRLRELRSRIRRAGDVGIVHMHDGFFVATGRFQGNCAGPFTKRQAIFVASRWALPSRPQVLIVTTDTERTVITTMPNGDRTSVTSTL